MNKLKMFLHPFQAFSEIIKESERNITERISQECKVDRFSVITDKLKYSAIHSQESGITKDHICDHVVVVSLTTYSLRIHEVYLTIESIMQGSIKPNRIILWLAKDEFEGKELPIALQNQMKRGLEVKYCEDIRSYKKIIPSLSLFPEACIITLDDDLIYEIDLLEHLVSSYKQNPDCVSACRIHRMKTNTDGIPLPYKQWDLLQYYDTPSHNNFLTSGGGALFPPNSLHRNVTDQETFLKLCPNADDIWLNAMLILNGVKVTKAFTHDLGGNDFIPNESPYVQSLWSKNQNEDGNDLQIKAVWQKYELNKNIKYK